MNIKKIIGVTAYLSIYVVIVWGFLFAYYRIQEGRVRDRFIWAKVHKENVDRR